MQFKNKQTPMTIRRAVFDDYQHIYQIQIAAFRPFFLDWKRILGEQTYTEFFDWENEWFTPPEKFSKQDWHECTIVTEIDDQIVGFAMWQPLNDETAEVGLNAVDPPFQGHGVGLAQTRLLLDMFRQNGYKCARVQTVIDPAHGRARALYRRVGFSKPVFNTS